MLKSKQMDEQNIVTPPTQRASMTHPLETVEGTLKSLQVNIDLTLRDILKKQWPKELHSSIKKEINHYLKIKEIYWPDVQQCWSHPDTEEKHSELKLYFFYATLHYLSAVKHLKNKNDLSAHISLAHAAHCIGFLDGYERRKGVHEIRQKRASKGGNEKASKKAVIKEHFPDLLKNRPKGGWGTERETIYYILNSAALKRITALRNINFSEDALYELLANEIQTPDNQKIYKQHRKK